MKKLFFILMVVLFCSVSAYADNHESFDDSELELEEDSLEMEFSEEGDLGEDVGEFSDEIEFDETFDEAEETSFFKNLLEPARFTIMHETSYKTEEPTGVQSNRSSIQLEYSKFFGNHFFLQFDTKANAYWSNDHRSKAEDEDVTYSTNTKEAFLQTSFGNTSVKIGKQIVIWGESDGGAITDLISPRDNSELFFISLQESRIGQNMVVLDQFSSIGDFNAFYIPEPEFNELPEEGTAYYFNPLADQFIIRDETSDDKLAEFGVRWKKTFGKSDISIMAASLIDNDYAYEAMPPKGPQKPTLIKKKHRFTLTGVTFNFAKGNFLFKGEIGRKSTRAFNDAMFNIIEKDKLDSALGLEYSPGGSYTLGFEFVNSHIIEWEEKIQRVPENSNSVVGVWSKTFFNEDLSVDWMTSYTTPHPAFLHSLRTSYKWDDNFTFKFEAFYPDIMDEENSFYIYKDQKQVAVKAQYQF